MSDGAAAGIDPRFDPRYQRGYDGHGATGGAGDASVQPMPTVMRVPDPPAPERITVSPRIVSMPLVANDDAPDPDATPAAHGTGGESFEGPAGSDGPTARSWLITGWTMTAVVFGIGLWWSWSVHSDVGRYLGGIASGDLAFYELGWSVSPALMTGGAVGAVVVTAIGVLLQSDSTSRDAEQTPRRRVAAWWALIGIAAASVIAAVWLASRLVVSAAVNSGLSLGANGSANADEQAQIAAMAFGQFAQSVIGPLATASIAAAVALVAIEVRRATLSAARARSARPDRP